MITRDEPAHVMRLECDFLKRNIAHCDVTITVTDQSREACLRLILELRGWAIFDQNKTICPQCLKRRKR